MSKNPDKTRNDAVKHFHKVKKWIMAEPDGYCNGRVYARSEDSQSLPTAEIVEPGPVKEEKNRHICEICKNPFILTVGRQKICQVCKNKIIKQERAKYWKEYHKRYRAKHKEHHAEYMREYMAQRRVKNMKKEIVLLNI